MPHKRRLDWFVSFVLLTIFTIVALTNVPSLLVNRAFAGDIHREFNGKPEILIGVTQQTQRSSIFDRVFFQHFQFLYKANTICSINQQQLDLLEQETDVTLENIQIGGQTVQTVKMNGFDMTEFELRRFLMKQGANTHCFVPRRFFNFTYLLFSAHVS